MPLSTLSVGLTEQTTPNLQPHLSCTSLEGQVFVCLHDAHRGSESRSICAPYPNQRGSFSGRLGLLFCKPSKSQVIRYKFCDQEARSRRRSWHPGRSQCTGACGLEVIKVSVSITVFIPHITIWGCFWGCSPPAPAPAPAPETETHDTPTQQLTESYSERHRFTNMRHDTQRHSRHTCQGLKPWCGGGFGPTGESGGCAACRLNKCLKPCCGQNSNTNLQNHHPLPPHKPSHRIAPIRSIQAQTIRNASANTHNRSSRVLESWKTSVLAVRFGPRVWVERTSTRFGPYLGLEFFLRSTPLHMGTHTE